MTASTTPADGRSSKKPSPLIRVLSQIRWPVLTGFDADKVADALAEQIGKDYPLRERAHEAQFLLTPEGVTQQVGGALHKFASGDGSWVVTLASTFITLETSAYKSHEDFIPRLAWVVGHLKEHLPLQRWDRFGYRYTNRISDEDDVRDLKELFDRAVLGTVGLEFPDTIVHSVGETIYQAQDASLLVKSALLPPNAVIELTIPPVPQRTWLLDLDAFVNGPSSAFDDTEIQRQATVLSKKAHGFFAKVTTDDFRSRFDV